MTDLPRPGLWRNLLAMVYDTFLVAPLVMAAAFVLVAAYGPVEDISEPTVPDWLMQTAAVLVIFAFFSIFWCKQGQTLGMQAWRIKLVREDGGAVEWQRALLRCISAIPSFALLGMGYWWSLVDPEGKRWHDRLSGTRLVQVPKPPKK